MSYSVTVVLATHRDSPELTRSVASVLNQSAVELELLVVGDGNPDGVQARLAEFADARIRYLPVPFGGLTKALIVGCEAAKYPYIARLDMGDFMLSGRLVKQAQVLEESSEVGLVSSQMSMYTPEGYYLFTTDYATASLQNALRAGDESTFVSPAHASVMFRQSIYQRAGGYRAAFYLTQDCDLWTRIVAISDLCNIDEVLTRGVFSSRGLSAQYAALQAEYRRSAIALRDALQDPQLTQQLLEATAKLFNPLARSGERDKAQQGNRAKLSASNSAGLYFMARCLMQHDSRHANEYWRRLLQAHPWQPRAWFYYCVNRLGPPKRSERDLDFAPMTAGE